MPDETRNPVETASQFVPILALGAVFYLLMVRPQQQRARAQREMLSALKAGDEIVTIGGLYGTVVETGERIRVRVYDGAELEFAPSAVSAVMGAQDGDADEAMPAEDARIVDGD